MSLKHPQYYGSGRCSGSGSEAVDVREDRNAWSGRAERIGLCPVCRRLFQVTKAGRVRPHVDYERDRRSARREEATA